MPILLDEARKIVFYHIPKTGGTSIEHAFLGPIVESMCGRHGVRKKSVNNNYDGYFKFTFVRNPWDRLHSMWHHTHRIKRYERWVGEDERKAFLNCETFHTFVIDYLSKHVGGHFMPMHHYFEYNAFDFVGRFETLQEDFNELCSIHDLDLELPRSNSYDDKPHYTEEYTDETIEMVRNLYRKDIDLLDYSFK